MKDSDQQREGFQDGSGKRFRVVRSLYHSDYTASMAQRAQQYLQDCGASVEDNVEVPGVFEIPLTIKILLDQPNTLDGIVAIGCVVRGETEHFNQIVSSCTRGIESLSLQYNIPIGHAILAVDNSAQATERSSEQHCRGLEAAQAVLALSLVLEKIRNE